MLGWPDELASLDRLGFRFGSHGVTHARLDRLSTAAMEAELVDSRDAIEQRFGRPCPLLAYPYGASERPGRDLAAATYEAAFGTRLAYASGSDDRSEIARVDAYYLKSRGSLDRLTSRPMAPPAGGPSGLEDDPPFGRRPGSNPRLIVPD